MAQIPSATPASLGNWMIGLTGFLMIVITILQVVSFFRRKPAIDAEFATKAELAKTEHEMNQSIASVKNEVSGLRDQLRDDYDKIQRSGEARASGIYKSITNLGEGFNKQFAALVESFGVVKGQVELLAKRFGCEK